MTAKWHLGSPLQFSHSFPHLFNFRQARISVLPEGEEFLFLFLVKIPKLGLKWPDESFCLTASAVIQIQG